MKCLFLLTSFCALTAGTAVGSDRFVAPSVDDAPALIECFSDPSIRFGASKALVKLGGSAVPSLTSALRADDIDVQIWSAYALGKIGPEASSAASELAKLLRSDDENVRMVAARSLGDIDARDVEAIDALSKSTADESVRVRQCAVVSLGKVAPVAQNAVPQLIDALDDQPVRAKAIRSLIQIGRAAIPMLEAALSDDNVRLEAAEALRKIDSASAKRLGVDNPTLDDLTALERSLLHSEKDVDARTRAATCLGSLGHEASPMLIKALAADSDAVVVAASNALGQIGPSAIPLLQHELDDESARVRAAAVDALAAIGRCAQNSEEAATPATSDVVSDLIAALTDDDRDVRHRAVVAIDAYGAATEPAIEALIAVMHNPRDLEATRQRAIKTLARIVPAKHEKTIAALRESTKDKNYGVSNLAKQMLESLGAGD